MSTSNNVQGIKSNRIYTFDTLKFLLIFCVIFHHASIPYFFKDNGVVWGRDSLFEAIYVFSMTATMPLFIIISGYFFRPLPLKCSLNRYLLPCLLFSVVNICMAKTSSAPFIHDREVYSFGYAMWFLWVLFVYSAITPP